MGAGRFFATRCSAFESTMLQNLLFVIWWWCLIHLGVISGHSHDPQVLAEMETDDNSNQFMIIGVAFIFFLLCSKVGLQEINHYCFGNITSAAITEVSEVKSTSRRASDRIEVQYVYVTNEGEERQGTDEVDVDWEPSEDGFQISYLDGAADRSKIHGVVNYFAVICFLGCGAVFSILGLRMWLRSRR